MKHLIQSSRNQIMDRTCIFLVLLGMVATGDASQASKIRAGGRRAMVGSGRALLQAAPHLPPSPPLSPDEKLDWPTPALPPPQPPLEKKLAIFNISCCPSIAAMQFPPPPDVVILPPTPPNAETPPPPPGQVCSGILSCIVFGVFEVLVFPLRVIQDILRWNFSFVGSICNAIFSNSCFGGATPSSPPPDLGDLPYPIFSTGTSMP
eukprot:jgi/Botrbrau1/15810/Bobra.4_1s0159.2